MSLSRRDWLKVAGAGTLAAFVNSACDNSGSGGNGGGDAFRGGGTSGELAGVVIPSEAPIPRPFQAPLPIPPVLSAARKDASTDYYEITQKTGEAQILPDRKTTIWGYDGMFPGPTIEARSGRRTVIRQRNELSVPVSVHLHGGVNPPESDGYPTDLILPSDGSFSPHDVHMDGFTFSRGDKEYVYPLNQRAMTLWYHDHRMDFTAPQVNYGLAGFFLVRDDDEDKLPLPKGDKEIPLMIADRSFAEDGSFRYPSLSPDLRSTHGVEPRFMSGVLGDVILVNGAPWPVLEVSNTKYRFRILNASNAREYDLRLDPGGDGSFVQIGSDNGLLERPVKLPSIQIVPAERFDVVIDFSRYPVGTRVVLRNGQDSGPTGNVMRFDVVRDEREDSTVPDQLVDRLDLPDPNRAATTRRFDFFQFDDQRWAINGELFTPDTILARPAKNSTEIWELTSDVNHPVHIHLGHFQVLEHGDSGGITPWDNGLKDTVRMSPNGWARVAIRFTEFTGKYVFHCHNLEHEDMGMMANFEVV